MTTHPWPLPAGPQANWNTRDWQAAANFYHYEIMGIDYDAPNYRPTLSLLEDGFKHAQRKAAAGNQPSCCCKKNA